MSVPAGSLPVRLYSRFRHLLRELGKFGLVGAVAYVVDVTIFNACEVTFHLGWFVSAVISTAIAASVAFVGNRFWTWRDRPRSGLGREYSLFFLFNVVGLGIGLACLWLSHDVLGGVWPAFRTVLADNVAKQVVGMTLGTLFRFWSYRRYVFPAAAPAVAPVAPSAAEPALPPMEVAAPEPATNPSAAR